VYRARLKIIQGRIRAARKTFKNIQRPFIGGSSVVHRPLSQGLTQGLTQGGKARAMATVGPQQGRAQTVGKYTNVHRSFIGGSSAIHRWFIGHSSVVHRPFIGGSSAIHRPFIGRSRKAWARYFAA
jgi:hypothetical protein